MNVRRRRTSALAIASATFALAYAGCGGGDSSSGGDDPIAKAVPTDAPLFIEGSVQPSSEQSQAIEAIAAKFPGGANLGSTIKREIDSGLSDELNPGAQPLDFDADIKPWLGDRAGIFFTDFSADNNGSVIAEVTDEDAAKAAIEKAAAADKPTESTSEQDGVEVTTDSDGDATAVTDGLFLAGSEAGVKAAISALNGGDDVTGSEEYDGAVERVDGDSALAFLYLDVGKTLEAAKAAQSNNPTSTDPAQVQSVLEGAGLDTSKPVSVSVTPQGNEVHATYSAPTTAASGGDSSLFDQLPAGSVVASAASGFGESLAKGIDLGVNQGGATDGTSEASATLDQISGFLGFDPTELGKALGDAGIFVRGSNLQSLEFGIVAEVTDQAPVDDAVSRIQGLLSNVPSVKSNPITVPGAQTAFNLKDPSLPFPIEFAYTGEQLFIGGGAGSAQLGLAPTQTIGGSPELQTLQSSLDGAEPSQFVDIQGLIALLEGAGAFKGEAGYAAAKPYLAPLGDLASGGASSEDGYSVADAVLTFSK